MVKQFSALVLTFRKTRGVSVVQVYAHKAFSFTRLYTYGKPNDAMSTRHLMIKQTTYRLCVNPSSVLRLTLASALSLARPLYTPLCHIAIVSYNEAEANRDKSISSRPHCGLMSSRSVLA